MPRRKDDLGVEWVAGEQGMAGLDSLVVLQQELQRIGKNQLTLRGAIENDKAIVLHPSQQASSYFVFDKVGCSCINPSAHKSEIRMQACTS